ncbi:MAG: GNAT family N-acetyltransferase [Sphingomonadales bacterium]|nr:GNAT family N-acetyltransferase [Sphingomonadales bacterium]MDE2569804.1 GNAT family N-acetyltransferase [Sphingomonadales bacterium]
MTALLADTEPLLVTDRLELWRPRAEDREDIYLAVEAEPVRRFLGGVPTTRFDEAGRFLRNGGSWALYGYGTFVLRPRGSAEIVGIAGVFHSWRGFGKGLDDVPEAGWILREDQWGKGLAGEAMRAVLAWFDAAHGPRRIGCMIEDGHGASLALAAKLGFERYDSHRPEGAERDLILLERG